MVSSLIVMFSRSVCFAQLLFEFETKSTWGKENDTLRLDIDPKSHFAWTGGSQKILDKGRVSKYNKKFSNLRTKK